MRRRACAVVMWCVVRVRPTFPQVRCGGRSTQTLFNTATTHALSARPSPQHTHTDKHQPLFLATTAPLTTLMANPRACDSQTMMGRRYGCPWVVLVMVEGVGRVCCDGVCCGSGRWSGWQQEGPQTLPFHSYLATFPGRPSWCSQIMHCVWCLWTIKNTDFRC